MKSAKCHNCGLVNFAEAFVCKRCNSAITNVPSNMANQQTLGTSQINHSVSSTNQTSPVKPSLISIVKNDYVALIGFAFPVLTWGLFIASNVFGISLSRRGNSLPTDAESPALLYIAIIGTIFGIALLIWRIHSFQKVFANGKEFIGQITTISFFKDRGRVEYSYNVNGQTYQSGNAIMKNKTTQSFQEGDEIELIVDSANYDKAYIKALYS